MIDLELHHEAGGYYKRPTTIVRGSGTLVWDDQGREYIDCVGGIGVANVGHANPRVVAAIAQQAQQLISCPELFHNDIRARYLERLAAVLPTGMSRIFLCNSGTEAVEAAIKAARLATGRPGVVATIRSFHGRTLGALSATWDPHYREPFGPLVPGYQHIRYNDIALLDAAITEETASFIVEPIQGEGGIHPATIDYLQAAERLCRERGAFFVLDEIQSGFGRTGRLWAHERFGVTPDLLCLAKGMAGGVPMGALGLGERVPSFPPGLHGSTFGGNPLACAAGLAVLDEIAAQDLPARAAAMGERLLAGLQEVMADRPAIRDVRGLGLMVGVELRARVQPYLERLTEQGVLALTAGNQVIRLLPPLVITLEQVDRVVAAFREVLQ
jgi:acetylornithine/LysW-gamma-L-lysine aminotransferase